MLFLTWVAAVLVAGLAVLLGFAAAMSAVPRLPRSQRLLLGGGGLLVLAGVVWLALDPAHGPWHALGPGLVAAFAILVAAVPTTRRGATLHAVTRDTVRGADGALRFADSAHNRALTVRECADLMARQCAGGPPPAGAASWDEHWRRYEVWLQQWQENAAAHVDLMRQARVPRS